MTHTPEPWAISPSGFDAVKVTEDPPGTRTVVRAMPSAMARPDAARIVETVNFCTGYKGLKAGGLAELVGALRSALETIDGLGADFLGCTDSDDDPSRLHRWDGTLADRFDWEDDARRTLKSLEKVDE